MKFRLKKLSLFIILLFILNIISYAEETKDVKEQKPTSLQRSVSPIFGYDPTNRYLFGGAYFVKLPEKRGYYLETMVMGSTRSGYALKIGYNKWTEEPYSYEIATAVSNYSDSYFGEGTDTDAENESRIKVFTYVLKPKIKYNFNKAFSAGTFIDLRGRDEKTEGISARRFPNEVTAGPGVNLTHDLRDNTLSSKSGCYSEINFSYFPEKLSRRQSTEDFWQSQIDLRAFKTINTRYTFAGRLGAFYSEKDPTYLFRYSLGGAETLRGYYGNRFRGKKGYLAQAEARIMLDKTVSLVLFADAGDITDSGFSPVKTDYGFGFRVGLPPDHLMKLRVDIGIGKDQGGLFVTFGEAF